MIVSFTGHRPNKIGGYKPNPIQTAICARIKEALIELKPTQAISGMALGVDQWAADICVELGIPFIAAVPFVGQERVWPQESKEKYQALIAKAQKVVIVSPGEYAAWKLQKRNEYLVDNCNKLMAIWGGTRGGTGNCVEYARSVNREIYRIDPNTFFSP